MKLFDLYIKFVNLVTVHAKGIDWLVLFNFYGAKIVIKYSH